MNTSNETPALLRVCFEGNIGVGKTTLIESVCEFLKQSSRFDRIIVERENVDAQLLECFNRSPSVYGLAFQQAMMEARFEMMLRSWQHLCDARLANQSCVVLIDTGPLRELAFTRANERVGNMSPGAADAHIELFLERIRSHPNIMPEHLLLIDAPVHQCVKNIARRSRGNEHLLTSSYLTNIRNEHLSQTTTLINNFPTLQLHTLEATYQDNYFVTVAKVLQLILVNHQHMAFLLVPTKM